MGLASSTGSEGSILGVVCGLDIQINRAALAFNRYWLMLLASFRSAMKKIEITARGSRVPGRGDRNDGSLFCIALFDAYFEPVEHGVGSPGQTFVLLPESARHAVREEVRRDLGDMGGPIEVEVEYRFGSGRR